MLDYQMSQLDDKTIEAIMQLKKASQMKIDTHHNLAKNAIETYYNYASAKPEIAKKAIAIASEETTKIYLDYLEKIARLNEEMMQRTIDVAADALKRCFEEDASMKEIAKKAEGEAKTSRKKDDKTSADSTPDTQKDTHRTRPSKT